MSLLTGLVAYWPFDEGQGTVARDATGNGHDGVVGSGCSWVGRVPGTNLFGINFPGGGALGVGGVTIPSPTPLLNFTGLTMVAWFKTTSVNVQNHMGFYGAGTSFPGYGFILNFPSVGNASFWSSGAGSWSSSGGTGLNDGKLHCHGVSMENISGVGGGMYQYVDGVPGSSGPLTFPLSYTGSRAIGMASAESSGGGVNSNWFTGIIAGVALWGRALSMMEHGQIHNGGQGFPHPFNIRRMGRPLGSRIIAP